MNLLKLRTKSLKKKPAYVLGVGQKIMVEITKMDDRGKLSLAPVIDEAEGADTESSAASSDGPEAPAEG